MKINNRPRTFLLSLAAAIFPVKIVPHREPMNSVCVCAVARNKFKCDAMSFTNDHAD